MKNKDIKVVVKVDGLDEVIEKLERLQKLIEEINNEALEVKVTSLTSK